jgi:hypothetical protein
MHHAEWRATIPNIQLHSVGGRFLGHVENLDDLIRSVRDAVRDHNTTALLIDDVTRLRLHRGDDQDTLDLIRELMDLNVTLVLIGAGIPSSGLLRGAYVDPRTRQWVFPRRQTPHRCLRLPPAHASLGANRARGLTEASYRRVVTADAGRIMPET